MKFHTIIVLVVLLFGSFDCRLLKLNEDPSNMLSVRSNLLSIGNETLRRAEIVMWQLHMSGGGDKNEDQLVIRDKSYKMSQMMAKLEGLDQVEKLTKTDRNAFWCLVRQLYQKELDLSTVLHCILSQSKQSIRTNWFFVLEES